MAACPVRWRSLAGPRDEGRVGASSLVHLPSSNSIAVPILWDKLYGIPSVVELPERSHLAIGDQHFGASCTMYEYSKTMLLQVYPT